MRRRFPLLVFAAAAAAGVRPVAGQAPARQVDRPDTLQCSSCAEWNAPQRPFQIFGNTYYVGTHGLSAILVTSLSGHVLIDGGLPESAPLIAAHVAELGFRMHDVRVILNSHAHFDHAGGIAELQRLSGARVQASPWSTRVLTRGASGPDDPQYGVIRSYAPVTSVTVVNDGDTVRVGELALTMHATGGHTPGGTSWSWRSCVGPRCRSVVYVDSQTSVSADGFYYTHSSTYPTGLADFARGASAIESLPCDILLTPHPDASSLWTRVAARDAGAPDALVNARACRDFAAQARQRVARRVASEAASR
jgi:metallo-beta-lactamase class B